jgi:hypothetical protein
MIVSRPFIGPSVNGSQGQATTQICAQTRPSELITAGGPAGAGAGIGQPPSVPSAAAGPHETRFSGAPRQRPARRIDTSWMISPLTGFQTRWLARPSSLSRCAADMADTAPGSAPSACQTVRGAPPFRCPPSAAARRCPTPGIHASLTPRPPSKGLDHPLGLALLTAYVSARQ